MAAIKSSILKRFDTAPLGIRVCCIKFVQRVVLVQTPGVITDPRVGASVSDEMGVVILICGYRDQSKTKYP